MGYVVRKISGFPGSQEELLSPLLPQWIIGYQCIPGASLPNAHCGSSQESINSASFEHPSTDRTSTALSWQKSKRDFTEKSPCIVPPPSQVWEIARYHREFQTVFMVVFQEPAACSNPRSFYKRSPDSLEPAKYWHPIDPFLKN